MTDPLSAASVGSAVITEGIKFLYNQAGEVLKRWRQRHEGDSGDAYEARLSPPQGLLEGTVKPYGPRDDYADRLQKDLHESRQLLADYADDIEIAQPGDHDVFERMDALRILLEAVYGQRITFKGERRQPSGPLVTGQIAIDQVAGDAAAIRAKLISSGQVTGSATVNRVEQGGKLTAVEIDRIG
jgi:hypothetical protein